MAFANIPNCIHTDGPITDPALVCNRPVHRKTHGFLCNFHYREQQASRPVGVIRRDQPPYKGFYAVEIDCEQIMKQERAEIVRLRGEGLVEEYSNGINTPLYIVKGQV